MKLFKFMLGAAVVFGLVFAGSIGLAGDAAKKDAKADSDVGVGSKAKLPKGEVVYQQDFESEDDVDSWMSDVSECEWHKGGCENSKGCVKFMTPIYEKNSSNGPENASEGYIECEKYINFDDDGTCIDFDYFGNGVGKEIYVRGISGSDGFNVYVKDPVKGKWAHAEVKCADMKSKSGETGLGKNFRTHAYIFVGVDKSEKDAYVLLDNVTITKTGKK